MNRKIKLVAVAFGASCVLALASFSANAYYDTGYNAFHKHRCHQACSTQKNCHKPTPCHKTNAGTKKMCPCHGK